MKKFEINNKYAMASPCDHNCVWVYVVIARTALTITLKDVSNGEIKKCRISKKISDYRDAETVFPLGKYSLCPLLSAK